MPVSISTLVSDLLTRLQTVAGGALMIGFDETRNWPDGTLGMLIKAGLIAPASPARTLVCDGCEEACVMQVHTIPGRDARAFIMCDKRDDIGRVPVALDRLQQWQIMETAVVGVLMAAAHDHPVDEQMIRDNLSLLPLREILWFEQGQLRVDVNRLVQRLLPETEQRKLNRFAQTGDHWTITYQGRAATFKNTKGLRYIAWLVHHQSKATLVSDLYYAINPPERESIDSIHSSMTVQQLEDMNLSVADLGDAGDVLTPGGTEYLQRQVKSLDERIEEAREFGDLDKQQQLEDEKEAICDHIAAAKGLGRRSRKASSNIERIRIAVTQRVNKDRERIAAVLPELGHHLKTNLHTGTRCLYSPNPPVEWVLDTQ
jgi:hypothetical protein